MENDEFQAAIDKVMCGEYSCTGIGTLGEKTLHRVLKYFFEPLDERHEKKVGRFVADIVNENGIIEIQTRNFNSMRRKLDNFLSVGRVTIVFPVAETKYLNWVNKDTSAVSKSRKSPKTGNIYEIVPELYKIKSYLNNENLSFCVVFLVIDEYRNLDGWSDDKKRGSSRYDRIPKTFVSKSCFGGNDGLRLFLPDMLPEQFTSKDLAKYAKISLNKAITLLNILNYTGTVNRVGKQGRLYLYEQVGIV